jgi:acyl-CoA synthetase (NDP forming)
VVSFGNGCDLDSVDFLEYFAADPETKVIGSYLEGVKQGRRFFGLIRDIAMTKPVVIWKGGKTEVGAAAAFSHTGSLAGSDAVWAGLARQTGAIKVESLEELTDTLLAFQDLSPFAGSRVSVVAGLGGGGGGVSVASGDAVTSQGLEILPFTPKTRGQLKAILPEAGAILRNPLDLGGAGEDRATLRRSLELALGDPGVDIAILNIPLGKTLGAPNLGSAKSACEVAIELRKGQPKPIVVYSTPTLSSDAQYELVMMLSAARIPVYPSLDQAARAIANVARYWRWRAG